MQSIVFSMLVYAEYIFQYASMQSILFSMLVYAAYTVQYVSKSRV